MTRGDPAVGQRARRVGYRTAALLTRQKPAPRVGSVQVGAKPLVDLVTEFDFGTLALGSAGGLELSGIAVEHQFARQTELPIVDGEVQSIEQLRPKANLATQGARERLSAGVGDNFSGIVAVIAAAEIQIDLWRRIP